jgi:hypothetical protein
LTPFYYHSVMNFVSAGEYVVQRKERFLMADGDAGEFGLDADPEPLSFGILAGDCRGTGVVA